MHFSSQDATDLRGMCPNASTCRIPRAYDAVTMPCCEDCAKINHDANHTPIVNANRVFLRQIAVRINLCAIDTFEVFALNKRLDPLLDHVDFRLELPS